MNVTAIGQVEVSVQELLCLNLKHIFSAADFEHTDTLSIRRCGTTTTLSGYTEWIGDIELPITIGWDWCITTHKLGAHCTQWYRNELPHTNIQLLNKHGHALTWEHNLRVLATWVDAQAWQAEVAAAVDAHKH